MVDTFYGRMATSTGPGLEEVLPLERLELWQTNSSQLRGQRTADRPRVRCGCNISGLRCHSGALGRAR